MARLFALVPVLLLALNAFAVAPEFWRTSTADEFLAGEIEGFAVNSRGELTPAPLARKVVSFDDPFVLSQTAGSGNDRFFGTGNDGKVYRLRGSELKVLFTAPEPEVYALAFRDGSLFAGTSPNGKVYRIDPESGKSTVFFDPGQAYIWALAPSADGLLVGTGVEGKLFRTDAKGNGTLLYDSPDTHIRSVARAADGSVLAGSSGKGRIYRVTSGGSAIALFESPLNEISSVVADAGGIAWAAGVTNVLPSAAPPKSQPKAAQQQQQAGGTSASSEGKKEETATASVDVSFSFEDGSASSAAQAGASEIYRIDPDGYVETVHKFEREMVYALTPGESGSVLAGTGPNGRVYRLAGGELSLLAAVPEKQVVSFAAGAQPVITTTNAGAVYRLEGRNGGESVFRSSTKDAEHFSRFGEYRIEGKNLDDKTLSIAFRSGNTKTPDATWSGWSEAKRGLEGTAAAPAARYLQWRITGTGLSPQAAIDSVTVAMMNRNIAPEIDALAVQDPSVVFISASYPTSPMLVEATNPDEYGIFTSLDSPSERAPEQGKRAFRRGFRTISWRASDENGDSLRYALSFRRKGSDRWLRLRENLDETQMNFDTSQLPDGRYELRLTASDASDNPDMPLSAVREGVEFVVDNTAPTIEATQNGDAVVLKVQDSASPVGKVEYSLDAQKWTRLLPEDGIADSREETFRLKKSETAGKFVVVRAVDAFYNVATKAVE